MGHHGKFPLAQKELMNSTCLEHGSPDQRQRCSSCLWGGLSPPSSYLVLTVRKTWLENCGHSATNWLIISNYCPLYMNRILISRSQSNDKLGTLMRTNSWYPPGKTKLTHAGVHMRECQGQFQCSKLRLLIYFWTCQPAGLHWPLGLSLLPDSQEITSS